MSAKEELLDYILRLTPEQVEKITRKLSSPKEDFIQFLRFSAEQLNSGRTVQEIWSDYQDGATENSDT